MMENLKLLKEKIFVKDIKFNFKAVAKVAASSSNSTIVQQQS